MLFFLSIFSFRPKLLFAFKEVICTAKKINNSLFTHATSSELESSFKIPTC